MGRFSYITESNEAVNGAHHVIARTLHLRLHLLSSRFHVQRRNNPCIGLERLRGFQKVEAPRLLTVGT